MKNTDLRKAGLKVTLPRKSILDTLENSGERHLSAEDIYKHLLNSDLDIGLATVYRVLTQFEAAGLVVRRNFEGGHFVFELASEEHHDHIVCNDCGHVEEFVDPVIEERQEVIAKDKSFRIVDHSMIIYGNCQRKNCPYRKSD